MELNRHVIVSFLAFALIGGCGKTAGIQKVSTDQGLGQTSSNTNSLQEPTELDTQIDMSQAASGALLDAGYTLTAKSLFGTSSE